MPSALIYVNQQSDFSLKDRQVAKTIEEIEGKPALPVQGTLD